MTTHEQASHKSTTPEMISGTMAVRRLMAAYLPDELDHRTICAVYSRLIAEERKAAELDDDEPETDLEIHALRAIATAAFSLRRSEADMAAARGLIEGLRCRLLKIASEEVWTLNRANGETGVELAVLDRIAADEGLRVRLGLVAGPSATEG